MKVISIVLPTSVTEQNKKTEQKKILAFVVEKILNSVDLIMGWGCRKKSIFYEGWPTDLLYE